MIRKFIPAFVLTLVASVCVLTAVGALAGAMAVWLSRYWGMGGALFAVCVLFLLLAVIAMLSARIWLTVASRRHDAVSDTVETLWKMNPVAVGAIGVALLLVVASRPRFFGRLLSAAAKSTGAVMLLRKIL